MYMYVYVYIHICICVCIYIYIYIKDSRASFPLKEERIFQESKDPEFSSNLQLSCIKKYEQLLIVWIVVNLYDKALEQYKEQQVCYKKQMPHVIQWN